MHWAILGLGGALVAFAALLKLVGGSSDLQQHALPFWSFATGIASLFLGGWHRDKAKVAPAGYAAGVTATIGAVSSHAAAATSPVLPTAPAMLPVHNLSSLQRSSMNAAPASATTATMSPVGASPDDIMARIRGLEAENDVLRAFLLEAKASISR
jgi:hypothetical protein